jgi:hypothetical protein
MAYQRVGDHSIRALQPAHLDNIELDTRYDPGSYKYVLPSGHSPNNNLKHGDDTKPLFGAGQDPGSKWPTQSQQVAHITMLRATLMIFDAILASTPIMFVGK